VRSAAATWIRSKPWLLVGDEIIFEFRDPVAHDLERIAAGLGFVSAAREIEGFHGSLEKAAAVVASRMSKPGRRPAISGWSRSWRAARPMIGAEPGWRLDAAEGRADAGRHLLRGLVRESDGEDPEGEKRSAAMRWTTAAVRWTSCGACAGEDQNWAGLCGGFGLGLG